MGLALLAAGLTGSAKELLPAKQVDNVEITVIPTYRFAANGAMYLDYMSVNHWGSATGLNNLSVSITALSDLSSMEGDFVSVSAPRPSGLFSMGRGGIEPPTLGLRVPCSTS